MNWLDQLELENNTPEVIEPLKVLDSETIALTLKDNTLTAVLKPIEVEIDTGIEVSQDGESKGKQKKINFVAGNNIDLAVTDDLNNDEIIVTINASAETGGKNLVINAMEDPLTVGGGIEFNGTRSIQTTAFSGDVMKSSGGTVLTLMPVNSGVGSFGDGTHIPNFTVNSKGLITDAGSTLIDFAPSSHTHTISNITGLQTALDNKASSTHTHAQSDITNLVSDLAAKIDDSQISAYGLTLIDDVDASAARTTLGLGTAATTNSSAYATASHTHIISDVTGLQTALDNKLDDSQATVFGLSLLDDADNTAARTTLGLGTLATQSGTFSGTHSGTSSGTNTGDQTITLTSDVTGSGTGSFATTIASGVVTLSKMANMATASILGRNTAGTGSPEVLSASTTKTLLSLNNVENTALSTWAGTTNLTTLGTIGTGSWNATNIPLNKGGTGVALTDPGADRLMFWDDSAGAVDWLTLGTNLTITGTTLDAAGGGGVNSFTTIAISGQSDVVADSSSDTLTLVAGSNITLTTNAGTDTITIAGTGGGSGLTQPQVMAVQSLRI